MYAIRSYYEFTLKHSAEGFELLDRAIALDPGYAYAYYSLAQTGIEIGALEKSLKLLEKGAGNGVFCFFGLIRAAGRC